MTSSEILVTQKEKSEIPPTVTLDFPNQETKIISRAYSGKGPKLFSYSTTKNLVLMQFCLFGDCTIQSSTCKKCLSVKDSFCNILYLPKGEIMLSFQSESYHGLSLYLEEDFFYRQIPDAHQAFNLQRNNTFGLVFSKNLSLGPMLRHILNEIYRSEFEGHLKILYQKAKVIELITFQLVQSEKEAINVLKESEMEKMAVVKQYIDTNLQEQFSLNNLAKIAGTNEQYLKKHFKMLYGNTVFGYILSTKMEKAKDMLITKQYRVTEIAEIMGYSHATHFTNAFKKFFGYLPKALKSIFIFRWYLAENYELVDTAVKISI